jgi:hypothetical protein
MSDHFFSRWSRRKQEAAKGVPLDEPTRPLAPSDAAAALPPVPGPLPAGAPVQTGAQTDVDTAAPLPTLADAQALTPASDFGAFMRQGVPSEVRNLAVKKLFADPHFNVMDGLDIYIGDYNTPDPLPAGMLQKMASAQFMNLVPPENPEATAPYAPIPIGKDPSIDPSDTTTSALVAQSPHSQATSAWPDTPPSEHDDPDLQLQPNHAPASPDPGPGAG